MKHPQSMTVFVTGGSGFVGSHVVSELIRRGHRVVATTTGRRCQHTLNSRVCWTPWEAGKAPLPDVNWSDFDAVVHLAKPPAPFDFPQDADLIYDVSVAATFRLLEALRTGGVPRFLLASTGDVLGPDAPPSRHTGLPYTPITFYGACKSCAELLAHAYDSILSTAVLRFYYPYGPGGDPYIVSRLIRSVSRGEEVTIEGPEGIQLNPVWVEDLARGVCLALESDEQGVFDLAGPDILSLRELAGMIGQLLGREPIIREAPVRDARRRVGDIEEARRRLGYQPTVSLPEGLSRLIGAAAEVAT